MLSSIDLPTAPFMSPSTTVTAASTDPPIGALKECQTPTSTSEETQIITEMPSDNHPVVPRSLFLQLPSKQNLRGAGGSSSCDVSTSGTSSDDGSSGSGSGSSSGVRYLRKR